MGFAEEAPELAVEGKLPWVLTGLGRSSTMLSLDECLRALKSSRSATAPYFASASDPGGAICLSKLRTLSSYREVFLNGLLRGNSEGAETRFSTVKHLFKRRLLDGAVPSHDESKGRDAVPEADVDFTEEVDELEGLTNYEVLIDSYEKKSATENAEFQEVAVYEFIALGLSAVFQHVRLALQDSGAEVHRRPSR